VVVNEAFAGQIFGAEDPIGQLIGSSFRGPAKADWQIIGVVRDAKYRSLREPMIATIYNSWQDARSNSINLYVRTRMRPDSIIQPVREILAQLDPALPFTEIDTMSDEIEASTAPERLTASLATIFAALAAILAAIGIYGLLAYVVAQRRREIGIRMALGARTLDIAEMIGWQAVAMTAAGIAIGLGAAMFTAPLVRALLYGVAPLDPVSFTLAAAFVLILTIAASAIPALRATRIDPSTALRQD
jgi:ABC-type antimicrobial peptide transport system permease subunit